MKYKSLKRPRRMRRPVPATAPRQRVGFLMPMMPSILPRPRRG